MKTITITLMVPDDCSVRVDGAQGSTTGRSNGRGVVAPEVGTAPSAAVRGRRGPPPTNNGS